MADEKNFIGFRLGGGIDPLHGFRVEDDLSRVHISNTLSTTSGSEISISVPLWLFLERNPDFYCYSSDIDGHVDVDDIRPKADSELS